MKIMMKVACAALSVIKAIGMALTMVGAAVVMATQIAIEKMRNK